MISLRNIKVIFKKEFLQLMRDKSVLFTNFFLPLFGLPLYLIFAVELASNLAKHETKAIKDSTVFTVSFQGEVPDNLKNLFVSDNKIKIKSPENSLAEEEIIQYREKFKNYQEANRKAGSLKQKIVNKTDNLQQIRETLHQSRTILRESREKIESAFKLSEDQVHIAFFRNDENIQVFYLFYANEKRLSRNAQEYVKKIIKKYEDDLIEKNKIEKKLSIQDWDPVTVWDVDMEATSSSLIKSIGVGIGGGILFLLLIAVYNPSINTTLGERDHHTYKLLLMNPISPLEIFLGKYLNVALQGMLTLIPYAIEFFIFYIWGTSMVFFENAPQLTISKLLILMAGTFSVSVFVSAICFLVSSFAKTRPQAQSLMTLLMFALMIPVASIGALDIKLTNLTAFLPLVNFPLMTENILMSSPNYLALVMGIILNIICSILIIWLSLGAFLVQWQGVADTRGLSDLLNLKRRKVIELIPAHAFMAFVIAFVGHVYGGMGLSLFRLDLFVYFFSPILFSLGTALFIIYYSGLDFLTILKWDGDRYKSLLTSALIGVGLAACIQFLAENLSNGNYFLNYKMPDLFEGKGAMFNLGYFILLALIPGICEEILFRGIIFQSLRKQYPLLIATLLSGVFFSIVHIAAYKQFYYFPLGIILAINYEKRGIANCIITHVCFNATLVFWGIY